MRDGSELFLPPQRIEAFTRAGLWRNRPLLAAFQEAVAKTPDKVLITDSEGERWTYAQTAQAAEALAERLAAIGIGAGDVISLQLPNCRETVISHIAALLLGAVTNPLLPNYREKDLGYILGLAKTRICVIPDRYRGHDYIAMYHGLRDQLPDLRAVLVTGPERGLAEGMVSFDRFLASPDRAPLPPPPEDCNRLSLLAFTSGTESRPKGVMHTENTMMAAALTMQELLGLTEQDVVWVPSPMGHGTGFQWGMRMAIMLGGSMVLQDRWDAGDAIRMIERERCTFAMAATPFAAMMLAAPEVDRHDLSSFRIFACAGAAIPENIGERFRQRLGCTLIGMWGMTECFIASSSAPDASGDRLWRSDGKAMPGMELAIFDETRTQRLKPGETGELATRGPFVAAGYFRNEEQTRETFREDGWLFSNDLATMDEDGYVRLVGRKKDIINRGGLKISAREIEELLLAQGKFTMVALVAVPDSRLGEKGCLFAVLEEGQQSSLEEITAYLEERGVAKFKLPEYYMELPELPMTASGKIMKAELRREFAEAE